MITRIVTRGRNVSVYHPTYLLRFSTHQHNYVHSLHVQYAVSSRHLQLNTVRLCRYSTPGEVSVSLAPVWLLSIKTHKNNENQQNGRFWPENFRLAAHKGVSLWRCAGLLLFTKRHMTLAPFGNLNTNFADGWVLSVVVHVVDDRSTIGFTASFVKKYGRDHLQCVCVHNTTHQKCSGEACPSRSRPEDLNEIFADGWVSLFMSSPMGRH